LAIGATHHAQGKKNMKAVNVIIPIYDGFFETIACLRSVLSAQNVAKHEIIAIYDAGPEPRLLNYLEELAERKLITLLKNPVNVGFIKTVNRGLSIHRDRDVVLLNSDTEVANNWLDRLLECAQSDPKIATVTPFSNNAEICSFPHLCQSSELPLGWDVSRVDRIFAQHVTPAAIDIPTAVGFCMYIARKAIDEIGYFNDELFGRGYGEENDFCRRLAAGGWRNVLCTNVFIYHRGAVSFGEEKTRLVSSAMEILDRLYPDYHRLVHEFIVTDSPQKYRVQAQLAMLDTNRPRVLCITHNLDGGTVKHVRELASYISQKAYCFVARMHSPQNLELSTTTAWGNINLYFRWPQQSELLFRVISSLGIVKAHIHHIKSIELFVDFLVKHHVRLAYDVTLHDYYLINGNPALTDKTGKFCSDAKIRDAICAEHASVPLNYTAEQWRQFTGELLSNAQRIFVPSHYAAALYSEYFPTLCFTVVPHSDWEVDAPYPLVCRSRLEPQQKFKVVALGALGLEKGADILEQTALLAAKLGYSLEFHLLGYAYRELNKAVIVHGAYDDNVLDKKLSAIAPHIVWFPCQWPETYSYTLSACLRGGFPVLAPALGAFIERLSNRPLSWLQAFPTTPAQWLAKITQIERDIFLDRDTQTFDWDGQLLPYTAQYSYANNYIEQSHGSGAHPISSSIWFDILQQLQVRPVHDLSSARRERILRVLLRLRQTRLLKICLRFIPFSFQRRIKRALSTRALHQIARDLL
jgi:O-antigen biosynthesis protein